MMGAAVGCFKFICQSAPGLAGAARVQSATIGAKPAGKSSNHRGVAVISPE